MKNMRTYKFFKQILIMIFVGFYCVQVSAQAPMYHVGDLYEDADGTKGVIFYLKPEGGGWIVALTDNSSGSKKWGNYTGILTPITDYQFGTQSDGYSNTATLRSVFPSGGYAANVVDFDNGWYLPSEEQLSILFASLSEIYDKFTQYAQYGGTPPSHTYWSSTPYSSNEAWAMNFQTGVRSRYNKDTNLPIRAIRDFPCEYPILVDSTLSFQWNTGDTTWNIEVLPEVTTSYYVVATNMEGDKDTAYYTLPVHPVYSAEEDTATCDSYVWHYHTYTESGDYVYHGHTHDYGCDSIIYLHLIINKSDTTDINVDTCNSYQWNGVVYDSSGVYEQNFQTVHGCDSTVYLHLDIRPNYFENIPINICTSQLPYTWRDTVFLEGTESQIDTFFKHSVYGCDSVVVLQLHVFPETVTYDTAKICGSYTIQDTTLYDSGEYEFHYEIPGAECDSVVNLMLTIYSEQEVTILDTACDVYYWKGNTYTETGEYVYTETNQSGCDSILHLKLYMKHSVVENFTGEVCKGDDYIDMENGFVVTHTDTMQIGCNDIEFYCGQSASGCDSIRVLHLSVYGKEVSIQSTRDTICTDETDSVTLEVIGDNYGYVVPTSCSEPIVAIGDILCTNGNIVKPAAFDSNVDTAKGIVFFVDATGVHGWAVALNEESNKQWSNIRVIINCSCGDTPCNSVRCALKDTCGFRNTRTMLDSAATINGLSFPVLENIDTNEGWYLPAAGQLRELIANVNIVNNSIDFIANLPNFINDDLMKININSNNRYWSSTENAQSKTYGAFPDGEIKAFTKDGYNNAKPRAVCSF